MHNPENMPYPNTVGLTSSDVKKSIAFYRDKLGFTLRECFPNEEKPMWASLALDKQSVMFGQSMSDGDCEGMAKSNPAHAAFWKEQHGRFMQGTHGAGVSLYFMVPDVDAQASKMTSKGAKPVLPPTTQFYGLRDTVITDPDGYTLVFYTPVKMSTCQSCAMPLKDATPGQMYCQYCTDEKGQLKSYEQVFEGTVTGFFMAMQKMPRDKAEKAAKEHLSKQPAWAMHG